MGDKHVIAIDFGTSRTSISRCPLDELIASPIQIDPGGLGLETAILYRHGKKPLIGSWATGEWGNVQGSGAVLKVHFKPEIAVSMEAHKAALDFLKELLCIAEEQYIPLSPKYNRVYFGVPSEADNKFKNAVLQIAKEAGFGSPELISEPIGALLYHVSRKDITTSEAQSGVLLIDFGGGTCDFAFLEELNIMGSWGDMLLGGRLFDDLFFQWFLDKNPSAERLMEDEGSRYFIHWYRCRQLKEDFSNYMSHSKEETWSYTIPGYGRLEDITWAEFLDRARRYKPSDEFMDYLSSTQITPSPLFSRESIDLLSWFEDTLVSGLSQNHIPKSRIEKVILAGGSSLWLFVPDIVQKVLNVDKDSIFRSEQPYAVIAQGMSLYPALKFKNQRAKDQLTKDLDRFIEDKIKKEILMPTALRISQDISRRSATIIFEDIIRPLLKDFRKSGGSVAELERRIQREVLDSMDGIESYIQERLEDVAVYLPYEIMEKVTLWFQEAGVYFVGQSDYRYMEHGELLQGYTIPGNLYKNLFGFVEKVIYGLVALITASICGGTGLALIASGPLGLLIGALVGLGASMFGVEVAQDKMKELHIDPRVLRVILSDRKLESIMLSGKKDFSRDLNEAIQKEIQGISKDVLEEAKFLILKEIASISALLQL